MARSTSNSTATSASGLVAALYRPLPSHVRPVVKALVYGLGVVPGFYALYLGLTDQLGADPVKTLERILGLWSLRFLVIGLAITPLRRFGGPNLVRYRRAIGLLAFFYAVAHVTVYVWLDQALMFEPIVKDIIKRPFITVGMLAFLILVPLAITSNNAMIKRVGGAVWQKLHKLVYVACAAAALHFTMLIKSWSFEPALYAALVVALLGWRAVDAFNKRRARGASSTF